MSANPNGAACYLAAVKHHATVDMKAQEIHDPARRRWRKSGPR